MNKIKLVYDVVKKLKEKEVFRGTLDVGIKKDQAQVFSLAKEFEKDTAQGQLKARISTEWDYQGKKGKHESSTEFNMAGCCAGMPSGHLKHMHKHHFTQGSKSCCGIKGKLGKISCFLNVLNNMKVEEKGDQGAVLSVSLNEFPEEIKKHITEHLEGKTHGQEHNEEKCGCMKELAALDDVKMDLTVNINHLSEIEKVALLASGKQKDEQNAAHEIDLTAELNLTW
ncbi:MAG: hypothetical protein AAGU27_06135 [Dehalobacterium sp.]